MKYNLGFAYLMCGTVMFSMLYCAVEGKLYMEIFFGFMTIYWKIAINRLSSDKRIIDGRYEDEDN